MEELVEMKAVDGWQEKKEWGNVKARKTYSGGSQNTDLARSAASPEKQLEILILDLLQTF